MSVNSGQLIFKWMDGVYFCDNTRILNVKGLRNLTSIPSSENVLSILLVLFNILWFHELCFHEKGLSLDLVTGKEESNGVCTEVILQALRST